RVEFNPNVTTPAGQATRNWGMANGQPNPNFFYDPAFAAEWKSRAVSVVTTQDTDLVRMVEQIDPTSGLPTWRPEPTVRFGGTPLANETLDPNTATATFETAGFQAAPRPPTQYVADYGNWSGPTADMTVPITDSVLMMPQPPPPGASAGILSQY